MHLARRQIGCVVAHGGSGQARQATKCDMHLALLLLLLREKERRRPPLSWGRYRWAAVLVLGDRTVRIVKGGSCSLPGLPEAQAVRYGM